MILSFSTCTVVRDSICILTRLITIKIEHKTSSNSSIAWYNIAQRKELGDVFADYRKRYQSGTVPRYEFMFGKKRVCGRYLPWHLCPEDGDCIRVVNPDIEPITVAIRGIGKNRSIGNMAGKDMDIEMKQTAEIIVTFRTYAREKRVPLYSLRFLQFGVTIGPVDTPWDMELEEGVDLPHIECEYFPGMMHDIYQ